MNTTERSVVTLLKSAITGEKLPLPADFVLEQTLPLIKSHGIAPLVYEGALHCGISKREPVMQSLFRGCCRMLLVSEGQLAEIRRIFAAFDENGIDYLPLKGCRMKALYPRPELRTMGDADILIRLEQYDRIAPVMEKLGFVRGPETDHELVWKSDKLLLELHKHLIPSYNEDYFAYFGTGWRRAARIRSGEHAMSREDEFIFNFSHFAKHFRDGGIGCRHVLDLWVYRRANSALDEAYIRAELEKLQLLAFYENICRLLACWFEDGQADEKTELISRFVFASGSFGQDEIRLLSRTVRDVHKGDGGRNGRLVYLWKTAFPDAATLQGKYPVLRKAPWMLPAVWVYRPFYKVLFETKSLKHQKENLAALRDENLDEHRQLLHHMGLDYRF